MNATNETKLLTSGDFVDEPAAWAAFDEIVDRCGAFTVYREVVGEYVQPRIETQDKGARIDRILIPSQKLIEAGWKRGGAIGVEGKKSGNKSGPLICQAMDYSRCAFGIKKKTGELIADIMLRWVFVYPAEGAFGDLASVMGNNRIGTCWIYRGGVVFGCNGTNAIRVEATGIVYAKDLPMGSKRGSR